MNPETKKAVKHEAKVKHRLYVELIAKRPNGRSVEFCGTIPLECHPDVMAIIDQLLDLQDMT